MEEIKNNGDAFSSDSSSSPSANDGMRSIPKAAELKDNLMVDTSFMGRVRRAFRSHGYLSLCFIVPTLLMLLVYASMNVFPFGEESVLVLDLNAQYVYYFEALRDIITDGGSLLYSFRRAMGGEFLGIIGYYLASPLSFIVALFPESMMTEALLCIFLLKVGASGLSLGIYLDRTRKRNPVLAVMFSTMYALCAYAVVMQHNTMWIDCLALLPLIILGVEELIKHKKYKLFVITLSIAVFSNFYIGFMTCIFVALYFFYYYYAHSEEERNPDGEANHLIKSVIRIGLCSVLMVAITAVMLWSSYTALQFGKTEFTDPSYNFNQKFDFLDLVSKMYFGSYDTVRPEGWPFVYSGMLTFMLVPLFFFLKKISLRKKIATGIFLVVMFVCFNGSLIDMFWHGLQNPNWLNHRYSYMVSFLFIIIAHRVFENLEELGYRPVIFSACTIGGVLLILQKLNYQNLPDLTAVWASLAFLAVYLLLLKGVTLPNIATKRTATLILTIFIGFEMYANGLDNLMSLDNDVVYTSRTTYRNHVDTYRPVFDKLQEIDSSFYRSEKVIYKKNNDNLALGTFGFSNSTSTLNADTIQFLHYVGLASQSHWSKYLGSTPATDSLLGIKYLVGENSATLPDYYTEIDSETVTVGELNKTLHIYKNPYAMSVAFGADESIADIDFFADDTEKAKNTGVENPFTRMNTIYGSLLGEGTADIFVNLEHSYPVTHNLTTGSASGHNKYTPVDANATSYISYEITAETDDVIYMYIPTTYTRECNLTVNNMSKGTYFGNETHRVVELGSYEPGTKLNIKLELNEDVLYIKASDYNYFYYFNEDVYLDAVTRLKGSEFRINEWTEDTLEGTINVAAGDELIFTTIPYDKGWKVIADGKEVETFEVLDSLIAFKLPAGEHELTMKYRPNCAVYGSLISVGGIVIFILTCTAEYVWKKRKAATVPAVAADVYGDSPEGEIGASADAEITDSTDNNDITE